MVRYDIDSISFKMENVIRGQMSVCVCMCVCVLVCSCFVCSCVRALWRTYIHSSVRPFVRSCVRVSVYIL